MKVSIITTIYKAEKDLPRLLDSMMAQDSPELEFFLMVLVQQVLLLLRINPFLRHLRFCIQVKICCVVISQFLILSSFNPFLFIFNTLLLNMKEKILWLNLYWR